MEEHLLSILQHIDLHTLNDLAHPLIDWWRSLDTSAISSGTLLLLLGIAWLFARIIRKTIGLLITLCVIYLTLRYTCGTDLLDLLHSPQAP